LGGVFVSKFNQTVIAAFVTMLSACTARADDDFVRALKLLSGAYKTDKQEWVYGPPKKTAERLEEFRKSRFKEKIVEELQKNAIRLLRLMT
jgi:hypothetical protein